MPAQPPVSGIAAEALHLVAPSPPLYNSGYKVGGTPPRRDSRPFFTLRLVASVEHGMARVLLPDCRQGVALGELEAGRLTKRLVVVSVLP